MTAKGKITASALTIGDRIIVVSGTLTAEQAAAWSWRVKEGDAYFHESRTKTGKDTLIVRVTDKTFRAASGKYERQGRFVIETTAGTFEAAGCQTMWLAPEDAAGIKRAHVEALAENADRDQAKADELAAALTERDAQEAAHYAAKVAADELFYAAAVREADHAEALVESAHRDATRQITDWAARHGMRSGYSKHVRLAIEADQAEAFAEAASRTPRQFCRKGFHSAVPAVTLTFDGGARRLHWCAEHVDDADQYRASSDDAEQDARTDRNVGPYARQFDRWVAEHGKAYTPAARMRDTEEQAYEENTRFDARTRTARLIEETIERVSGHDIKTNVDLRKILAAVRDGMHPKSVARRLRPLADASRTEHVRREVNDLADAVGRVPAGPEDIDVQHARIVAEAAASGINIRMGVTDGWRRMNAPPS